MAVRTDIFERENEIREWISQHKSKNDMCKELHCSFNTLNKYLKLMNIEYKGSSSFQDLTGQTFGQWKVLYFAKKNQYNQAIWHCQCSCGKEVDVLATSLKSGKSSRCVECGAKVTGEKRRTDIANQRFGLLVALYPTDEKCGNNIKWKCQCDCGNQPTISAQALKSGSTQSCGCTTKSHGEIKIEQLLIENNIPYETQYSFEDCRFPESNKKARFDFAIFDNQHNLQYLIEYDGEQHFYYNTRSAWNTKENFDKAQKRDAFKNYYCKTHNIPLLRIPYTILSEINLSTLLFTKDNPYAI